MKIHAVSGYSEVGKNMTAVEINDDVFLFDSGLYLPAIVGVEEKEKIPTEKGMRNLGALPNDEYLEKNELREKVRALFVSHAHLDHVGAIPYNAHRYNAGVYGTPYTMEVLNVLMKDNNQRIDNKRISIKPNGSTIIKGKSEKYRVEFINITHSTIQSAIVALHTPEGVVLYANDFKLDNTPTFGEKPNYKRLRELSQIGVKALIVDSLYAESERKTPSEKIARGLLEDVLFTTENRNSGIVITTFSSHIARLKTITDFGRRLGREIIFLGRSLSKYTQAAKNIGKGNFMRGVKVYTYRRQLEKAVRNVNRNKSRYLVVCTGHQGEPGSILDRISRDELSLNLTNEDHIIFSSRTIPTPVNEQSRVQLEKRLKRYKVRIFDNVHVSGHGGKEDIRDLIKLTKPKYIIPSHGGLDKTEAGADLARELGYRLNKTVHLMTDGRMVSLK